MEIDVDGVPRWQVFGERSLYDNPWVRLVQVDVEPPDGRRFWHHVVRLQTVAAAAVVNHGHVLMLLRHRFATGEVGWELPGGIVGPEESSAAAAVRETEEETGWRPTGTPTPIARFQPMPGMVDTPHEVFVIKGAEHIGAPSDLEEAGRVDWIALMDVPAMIRAGEVLGSGSLVGLLALLVPGMVEQQFNVADPLALSKRANLSGQSPRFYDMLGGFVGVASDDQRMGEVNVQLRSATDKRVVHPCEGEFEIFYGRLVSKARRRVPPPTCQVELIEHYVRQLWIGRIAGHGLRGTIEVAIAFRVSGDQPGPIAARALDLDSVSVGR